MAVYRHSRGHLPATLAKSPDAREVARADNLLVQVRDLQDKALHILERAEAAGDLRAATSAIREARGCLELLGKLAGELQETTVNIVVAPQWLALRGRILVALAPFAEARVAVSRALLEAGDAGS
jgi:hypothetical protein